MMNDPSKPGNFFQIYSFTERREMRIWKMIRKRAGGRKVANGKWIAASGETFAARIANHASFRGLEILRETFWTFHVANKVLTFKADS